MPHPDISIIIPVFNQWDLTRNCLKSLAETAPGHNIEVIIVDNASTDRTAAACPFLGRQLFGKKFLFLRNEQNLNFGPASNQGARQANAEYLLFLNNDTILQPGWLEPLLEDFRTFPGIAATGPMLVYPEDGIFGHRVQHLGVYVSPLNFINHLYEGIPASSPLARKRRFFQIITAACMLMPKKLFMDAGMFDEAYVNGFEDVDLCARLSHAGYRMTVNPDCRVVHLQGQTPGRFKRESGNWDHWRAGNAKLVHADWRELVEADGLTLKLDAGLNLRPMPPESVKEALDKLPERISKDALLELIVQNPNWENGWKRLAARTENASQKVVLARATAKLFNSADSKIMACEAALAVNDREEAANWLNALSSDVESMHKLKADANFLRLLSSVNKDEKLAADVVDWQKKCPEIHDNYLRPLLKSYLRLSSALGIAPAPRSQYAYAAWNEVVDGLARRTEAQKEEFADKSADAPLISVLVPVYNPEPAHLRAAIESVLAQDYENWELCLADDASPDARIRPIIEEYAARDTRIKTAWRDKNGNIAQATNTALDMASGKYCALLDQDDILTADALSIMAGAIRRNPDGLLFYSDEDKLNQFGEFYFPYFKNGKWDDELILTQNFVCHFGMYETARLREIKGFRDGFPGSQDHDLLLRFIQGQQPSRFIHVPHVLYHWRMHEGSTSLSTAAKPESVDSARRAAQAYLDINYPGAFIKPIPDSHLRRIVYPLPKEKPSVTLIFESDKLPPDAILLEQWKNSASWPVEILALIPENKAHKLPDFIKALPMAANLSPEMGCLEAARQASGDILGFLSPWLRPESEGCLQEMVSILWRPGVGACGGMILNKGKKALHAGYLTDASASLKPLWQGSNAWVAKWFNWNISTRVVDALDSTCLFTRRDLFLARGGFNPVFSPWAAQDYCLRLTESGWRVIWHPFALFSLDRRLQLPPAPEAFQAAWKDRLKPFNKNILIGEELILAGEVKS